MKAVYFGICFYVVSCLLCLDLAVAETEYYLAGQRVTYEEVLEAVAWSQGCRTEVKTLRKNLKQGQFESKKEFQDRKEKLESKIERMDCNKFRKELTVLIYNDVDIRYSQNRKRLSIPLPSVSANKEGVLIKGIHITKSRYFINRNRLINFNKRVFGSESEVILGGPHKNHLRFDNPHSTQRRDFMINNVSLDTARRIKNQEKDLVWKLQGVLATSVKYDRYRRLYEGISLYGPARNPEIALYNASNNTQLLHASITVIY